MDIRTLRLPAGAGRFADGIVIDYSRDAQELQFRGSYDSGFYLHGGEILLVDFLTALGITEADITNAFATNQTT